MAVRFLTARGVDHAEQPSLLRARTQVCDSRSGMEAAAAASLTWRRTSSSSRHSRIAQSQGQYSPSAMFSPTRGEEPTFDRCEQWAITLCRSGLEVARLTELDADNRFALPVLVLHVRADEAVFVSTRLHSVSMLGDRRALDRWDSQKKRE